MSAKWFTIIGVIVGFISMSVLLDVMATPIKPVQGQDKRYVFQMTVPCPSSPDGAVTVPVTELEEMDAVAGYMERRITPQKFIEEMHTADPTTWRTPVGTQLLIQFVTQCPPMVPTDPSA